MSERTLSIPGWRIVRVIGKGGFGCVYEVEKEGAFGSVAHSALKIISIPETDAEVKAYRDDGYDDRSLTDLFRKQVESITAEFELMSKLKGDSHIVSYEDHSIVQHKHDPGYDIFIRMELLTPLPDCFKRTFSDNRIPDAAIAALGVDICRALERCGRHNIIHRDIKPQNIFVNEEGDFKLGDFGIAKTSDHTMRATKTGTYGYMAPEVYWGRPYNATVDIYSLGLVLYWMLNERRGPFLPLPPASPKSAQNAEAMERRMHGEALPAPKNGSEALKRIVLKACAFDPKDRYQNPAEMRRDLERTIIAKKEAETIAAPIRPVRGVSMDAFEQTLGAYRKEMDADQTIGATSESNTVKTSERAATVPNEIKMPRPRGDFDATVGAFRAETGKNTDAYENETVRVEAEPIPEAGPAALAGDADATVGLFVKKREAAKPLVRKEPERKTEPAPKSEKKQTDRKTAGNGSKKTLLIVAAAAALAVIAAVVLIVVLAGKGEPAQQAEVPTAAPTDTPSIILSDAPSFVPTETPMSAQSQKPAEESTSTPSPEPAVNPSAVFVNETFEKAFRDKYGFAGPIYQSDVLAFTELDLCDYGITDITDVLQFSNLTKIRFDNNAISSISCLKELPDLVYIDMCCNQIGDISVLEDLRSIEHLNLNNNQISDLTSLHDLTMLTFLDLRMNSIDDISALKGCTNLIWLDLSGNQINDITVLRELVNVQMLGLSENPVRDISVLCGLTNLTQLFLKHVKVEDFSPLSAMTGLTELDLGTNGISNVSMLQGLTNLTRLDLSENQIKSITALNGLTNLVLLSLDRNQIKDISALSEMTDLTMLYLSDNQIRDISAVSGLVHLQMLYIPHNKISDISAVAGLTELTELSMDYNQIDDISAISGLTKLTKLYVSHHSVSDISALRSLTDLTVLSIDYNQIQDISVLSGLTNLTVLYLSKNIIDDISALRGLTNLTELYVYDCQIKDISALEELTNLTYLNLHGNKISDISSLGQLTRLKQLYLYSNQINDLSALSKLVELTNLDVRWNNLTRKQIDEMKTILPNCSIRH